MPNKLGYDKKKVQSGTLPSRSKFYVHHKSTRTYLNSNKRPPNNNKYESELNGTAISTLEEYQNKPKVLITS